MKLTPLIYLRSFIFTLCFFAWALFTSIIFAPLFIISSNAALKAGPPWAKGSLILARLICGISYEIRGAQYINISPVIFAAKHQSAWDTVIFLALFPRPAYILKRELLRLPGWGWYLWRMKMIAIDRSGKASAMKQMIKDSKAALEDGRPIVIYPEGTRTRVGAPAQYHPGVVALYSMLKVPVVPIALNSGVFWGKNALIKYPGKIIMEFMPPIQPGLDKDQFLETLQTAIETKTQKLVDEARKI